MELLLAFEKCREWSGLGDEHVNELDCSTEMDSGGMANGDFDRLLETGTRDRLLDRPLRTLEAIASKKDDSVGDVVEPAVLRRETKDVGDISPGDIGDDGDCGWLIERAEERIGIGACDCVGGGEGDIYFSLCWNSGVPMGTGQEKKDGKELKRRSKLRDLEVRG